LINARCAAGSRRGRRTTPRARLRAWGIWNRFFTFLVNDEVLVRNPMSAIQVTGKGNKDRAIPIEPALEALLDRYLQWRSERHGTDSLDDPTARQLSTTTAAGSRAGPIQWRSRFCIVSCAVRVHEAGCESRFGCASWGSMRRPSRPRSAPARPWLLPVCAICGPRRLTPSALRSGGG